MMAEELFLARLAALDERLTEAKRAVEGVKDININLHLRAAAEFHHRIGEEHSKIKNQQTMIANGFFDSANWVALQGNERDCSTLFRECLAFLQAAHARGRDVDDGLCEIADALLDELAKATGITWNRFTVLASEEFFFDMAQIIRLRFPLCGIWDLPVSSHEFGHFVAGRLNRTKPGGTGHELPFQKYKEAFKPQHPEDGDKWIFYLEELFADMFATYTLGPAYACVCLLHRFDPSSAHTEQDNKHPSYAWRTQTILQTLERMNMEEDSAGDFRTPIDRLKDFWQVSLSAANASPTEVLEDSQINGIVSSLYPMLRAGVPHARYNRWTMARKMKLWLDDGQPPNSDAADFKISDLLNTAWLCRLKPGSNPAQLSKNVIDLCRLHADNN